MTAVKGKEKNIRDVVLMEIHAEGGILSSDLYSRVEQATKNITRGEAQIEIADMEKLRIIRREFSSAENDRIYLTRIGYRMAEKLLGSVPWCF